MVKFKDFSRSFSVFQGLFIANFIFQGLFKTVLYIQVLFKPVQILLTEDLLKISHLLKFYDNGKVLMKLNALMCLNCL